MEGRLTMPFTVISLNVKIPFRVVAFDASGESTWMIPPAYSVALPPRSRLDYGKVIHSRGGILPHYLTILKIEISNPLFDEPCALWFWVRSFASERYISRESGNTD